MDISSVIRKYLFHFQAEFNNLIKYLLFKQKFDFFSIPRKLQIELTNICSANCIFCAYQYQTRPKGYMKENLFQSIIQDFVTMGGKNIILTPLVGEPLLHPKISEFITFARKQGIEMVRISTNMIAPKINLKQLITSGVTEILVSTAGFQQKIYERTYRTGKYSIMLKNTSELLRLNKEFGFPTQVTIAFRSPIGRKSNFKHEDFKKYIKPYVGGGNILTFAEIYDNWGGLINQSDLIGRMLISPSKIKYRWPCKFVFRGNISYDGIVRVCGCRFNNNPDYDEMVIGKISSKRTFKDIWFSNRRIHFLNRFLLGKLPSVCKNCTMYEIS
ncbi:MAG: radical SAM/SPASM domain-containing protein [Candidatus Helarchaeota archaeon]